MNTEQLKAEFEPWMESRAINYDKDTDAWGREKYKHSHVQAMFEGYQAAAQSRDELIGKLVEALGDIGYAKTWSINNRPFDMVKIALDALAEAKAQGYGE